MSNIVFGASYYSVTWVNEIPDSGLLRFLLALPCIFLAPSLAFESCVNNTCTGYFNKVSMNYKFRGKLEEMTVVYECTCRQQTVMVIVTGHASIEYIKTNRFWIQPKLDKPVVKWIWSTSVIQPDAPFQ